MTALSTLVQAAPRTPPNLGIMPIDPALAKRVRAVAQAAEKKRQERDALIRAAHAAGGSYREIAALVGLSHVGVMKIVGKVPHVEVTGVEGTIPLDVLREVEGDVADRLDPNR